MLHHNARPQHSQGNADVLQRQPQPRQQGAGHLICLKLVLPAERLGLAGKLLRPKAGRLRFVSNAPAPRQAGAYLSAPPGVRLKARQRCVVQTPVVLS